MIGNDRKYEEVEDDMRLVLSHEESQYFCLFNDGLLGMSNISHTE